MIQVCVRDFPEWRKTARSLLNKTVQPHKIIWTNSAQNALFTNDCDAPDERKLHKVAAEFLPLAENVACFDSPEKWNLLYRILFRLVYENRYLLHIESDADVRQARLMEKAISRDIHKFHAFVRFRQTLIDEQEIFVAWHVPTHFTVEKSAPFFVRRFGSMKFSILTPKGCAHWDLNKLAFSEGVSKDFLPKEDKTEEFWLAYYRSIFNPFRLKIKAMKAEMPVKHWKTLPEAALIPEMIQHAKHLNEKYKKF